MLIKPQTNTIDHHRREEHSVDDVVDATTALLPRAEHTTPYPRMPAAPSREMQLSTRISSYGVGIGYFAAVIVQILSVVIIKTTSPTLFSLRLVLFVIGLWWLVFTIPAALWLRPRPGPPLSFESEDGKARTWLGYISYSWVNLGKTIVRARKLRDLLLFLAAWFMVRLRKHHWDV
jgi:MFS transporter, UMF1 family